jgi:hypothetical protein
MKIRKGMKKIRFIPLWNKFFAISVRGGAFQTRR